MSHPLTRRIAQAALVVAAGATPLVAAGSASALGGDALLPKSDLAAPLGQLTNTDTGSTLQHTTHQLGQAAGTTGAATVAAGVPASADAAGNIIAHQLPEANEKASSLTAPVDQTAATTGQLSAVTPKVASALAGKLGEAVTGKGAENRSANAGSSPVGGLAQAGSVAQALPGADKLSGAVPGTNAVTDALPLGSVERALPLGSVEHTLAGAPGTDVLGLAEHGSANRLGGADLGPNNPLSGLTGALGPVGGLLNGVNGGSISGLPL
ncbi:hypothetical protein BX285_0403 [Streptomyces sp. 1114.5]|uniref:hypothetical protein n=1 Tax=Streptomyces sp. 1114.5 TaxID=1938830 RepID=UPI000F2C5316|nr:hypothetical protein [Streptomyces sp. 1114.5]RKT16078.1 hypothetical protein BX285_0403 [Streptomyces sp. 1114.5]